MTRTRFRGALLSATAFAVALVLGACGATGVIGSPSKGSSTTGSGSGTPSSTSLPGSASPAASDGPGGDSNSGTSDQDDPADDWCLAVTQAEIRYARGTVAPPYHYQWTLSVTGTRATFTMRGGYGDDPSATWSQDFDMDRQTLADLCDAVTRFAGDPGAGVGGDRSSYTITSQKPDDGPDRRKGDIRSPLDFGSYVLTSVVPGKVRAKADAQFQAWSYAQQAKTDGAEAVPDVQEGDPVAPSDAPDGFCDGASSGRIAYSSRGSERTDRMELLLTFADGRASLVVTSDFSGSAAQWRASWEIDPAQQQKLCALALSTLQDAPAGEPDPRSPGLDIVLTDGGQMVDGADLDLSDASDSFLAGLRDVAGDEVTAQTFGKWQKWVAQG